MNVFHLNSLKGKINLSIYTCFILLVLSCQQQNITPNNLNAFNCYKDTRGLIDTALLNYKWLSQNGDTINFKYIPSTIALDYSFLIKKGDGSSVLGCGGEFSDYQISDGFYGSVTLNGCDNYYLTIDKMYMNAASSIGAYSIDSIYLYYGNFLYTPIPDTFKLSKIY